MAYGSAEKVKLGSCRVYYFDKNDSGAPDVFTSGWGSDLAGYSLGYTQGGVSVLFSTESQEVEVDQEAVPVQERITKQTIEVTAPLIETSLETFAKLIPAATLTTDTTSANKKLELSGDVVDDINVMAQTLVLVPNVDDTGAPVIDEDVVVLHRALPNPNFEYSYEKDSARVYEVTFKALKDSAGNFVTFGDPSIV